MTRYFFPLVVWIVLGGELGMIDEGAKLTALWMAEIQRRARMVL